MQKQKKNIAPKTKELSNVVPKGWISLQLKDLLDMLTDFEANGSFAGVKDNVTIYDSPNHAWYVRATDLENNSPLSSVKYVDKKSYDFLKKTPLFGGELLITKRGEIGKVYFFSAPNIPATVAPNMYLLKVNEKANPKFLYYYFKNTFGNNQLKRLDASSTLGALYKDDVKSIKLQIPSVLDEQIKIAKILSTCDEAIETVEKLIELKEKQNRGLMQTLLTGKNRFKGFKEIFKEVKFADVAELKHGYQFREYDFVADGIPVIKIANLSADGQLLLNNLTYVDDKRKKEFENVILSEGDILMALSGIHTL